MAITTTVPWRHHDIICVYYFTRFGRTAPLFSSGFAFFVQIFLKRNLYQKFVNAEYRASSDPEEFLIGIEQIAAKMQTNRIWFARGGH